MNLLRAIIADDVAEVTKLIEGSPGLVRQSLALGASRQDAQEFFFEEIKHYLYAGDTPLHAAAACYRLNIARELIQRGANVIRFNFPESEGYLRVRW